MVSYLTFIKEYHAKRSRYHGKCLKIARGKVKDVDKYTCPICDWRVKIPRDAARPKLEDLQDWQHEISSLPFQPDEEQLLEDIIDKAQTFREFLQPYTNPVSTTQEEVPTQLFYLRKIEGAEVLLAYETNFFRQEIHKWQPVAPEPPPILDQSLSTRKPRPTKQQKMMAQLGVEKVEDLPPHLRTKPHTFTKRKHSEAHAKQPPPLQPAPQLGSTTPLSLPHSASTGNAPSNHVLADVMTTQPPSSFPFEAPFAAMASPHTGSPLVTPGTAPFLTHAPLGSPGYPDPSMSQQAGLDPNSLFSPDEFFRTAHEARESAERAASKEDGNAFSSSPHANMDDMFASLTNQDVEADGLESSHASDAMDAMKSAGASAAGDDEGGVDSAQSLADEFLN